MGGIGAIGSAIASGAAGGASALPSLPKVGTEAAASTGGRDGFGGALIGALDDLNAMHQGADQLAIQAATGDLADVHEYTIAATQAELATQLTVAVRDKAVEAFNDIMRMQF